MAQNNQNESKEQNRQNQQNQKSDTEFSKEMNAKKAGKNQK
ncbi:hypothetical protein [Bacillus sp. FJAT-42376]|nr:hypothetical protein [Bacillus sp. FJAT-42376]